MGPRDRRVDVVRREELGLQPDAVAEKTSAVGVWLEVPVFIVEDSPEVLVSYIAPGAQFEFPGGHWPTLNGLHPWSERESWFGHRCLMVQRPGDHYAVWHFWDGPDHEFSCWYLNLQTSFVRTPTGYNTQDLELDIVRNEQRMDDVTVTRGVEDFAHYLVSEGPIEGQRSLTVADTEPDMDRPPTDLWTVWLVSSPESFIQLTDGYGLSLDEFQLWVEQMLRDTVVSPTR